MARRKMWAGIGLGIILAILMILILAMWSVDSALVVGLRDGFAATGGPYFMGFDIISWYQLTHLMLLFAVIGIIPYIILFGRTRSAPGFGKQWSKVLSYVFLALFFIGFMLIDVYVAQRGWHIYATTGAPVDLWAMQDFLFDFSGFYYWLSIPFFGPLLYLWLGPFFSYQSIALLWFVCEIMIAISVPGLVVSLYFAGKRSGGRR